MEAYFEKEKDAQINPDEITVARITHYKADVLFSLVMEIVFHSTIHFDTFSAFFDFSFIESSLIKFSMDERFQIFEALLKTYIEQLKIMSEKDFTVYLWEELLSPGPTRSQMHTYTAIPSCSCLLTKPFFLKQKN